MSHGKEVAFCILVSYCLVPLSFFQLKDFELKHLDWCFSSSGKWLWRWILKLRTMVICQPVSKWGRGLYWGTFCLSVCVVECFCLALGLCFSLSFSLCASCRPCHEFSLTPWGHSHMKLWCVCPELDWQGSFGGSSRETKRKGQGFELKGFELWDAVLTYLLQNVNYLPR